MNIEITRPINREEWLRALHAKGTADKRLAASLDEGERLLKAAARPKAVYKLIQRADFHIEGAAIEKHLEGCHEIIVMAVTLGIGVDQLIRKTQITDMAMAVILDTGASVLADQLADEFQDHIRQQIEGKAMGTASGDTDVYMTFRFSPGYGDYPITEQTRIVRYLDAQRQIGLNLTSDSLMIPRKSITAVIGVADHPVKGKLATCDQCVLRDKCELRKEGKFCGDRF